MTFKIGDTVYIPLLEPHSDTPRGESKENTVATVHEVVVAGFYDNGTGYTAILDRNGDVWTLEDTSSRPVEKEYTIHATREAAEIEAKQQYLTYMGKILRDTVKTRSDV